MSVELNQYQLQAVEHVHGPLLILAGAGTGKTKVLTSRIAHIIDHGLAQPWNILAVTFTNKAAWEMQERVKNLTSADGLNIGTFHSIAARMLRTHVDLLNLNLTRNFTIIDQDDQIKLIKNILLQKNIDTKQYEPKVIHSIISRWKDQGLLADKMSYASYYTSMKHRKAEAVYSEYQSQMASSNVVDFGDLLLYCNKLLVEHADILHHYQQKFQYILIDEYQDTNPVQYLWARMLANKHHNICCVGDDDQSIYSWRGAEVKNILRFEQDFPNATIIKLEQNYRSTPYILSAAAHVISYNKHRHGKVLWTEKQAGEKIRIVSCWNEKEEARFIADEISKVTATHQYQPNDIAILVRAGFQTRSFEEVFISNAIPYQIVGGVRFYERMEIRDLLAYIRLSVNHDDNIALERIINNPKRAVGSIALKKIKEFAYGNQMSLFTVLQHMVEHKTLPNKTAQNIGLFVTMIKEANQRYQASSPVDVTKFLLEASGYLNALQVEKTEESRSRIENIQEMLRAINEFESMAEFMEHISLIMDNDSLAKHTGSTIKIMTLHASKGLEFNLVFLPGWEENIFPHQKALAEGNEQNLEEERRIAYVGITRAKKELFITYAESRRVFAEFMYSVPSRFLKEIPAELCLVYSSNSRPDRTNSTNSTVSDRDQGYAHALVAKAQQIRSCQKQNLTIGCKVSHQQFGVGTLIKQNGDSLDIVFRGAGLKTIKMDYINLVQEKR